MAKVDTIKLNIDGTEHEYNVNVGKDGIFKVELHWEVAKKLGLQDSRIQFSKLDELRSFVIQAYKKYLDATNKEELLIWIGYKSNGYFKRNKEGGYLFGINHRDFDSHGFSGDFSRVEFDFGVIIRQTMSTGVVNYYSTEKGQGCVNYGEGDLKDPNTYYKRSSIYSVKGKVIPYSEEALQTLEKAREGIRSISEILFNLVSSEEKQIEAVLRGGKLLGNGANIN